MRKTTVLFTVMLIVLVSLLNLHIIRTHDGIEVITKDSMTFRDTFTDVRKWRFTDYISHSPRIRNYLIYEKHYPALMAMLRQNTVPAKLKLREFEEAVHQWLSEKLK
ncbi:hypothetical protein [Desulfonema magnum]|uniref:Uncharacterized protein n=1 Tax=Desulfonema magnum TaxID=45655 RepID=A0A975BRC2_9BACT|nr:hypothetical protein [Desulfonema magnum]QTA90424.1 Uncharacterized protein dnm_064850 [Desulfonema magnum]